MTGPTAGDRLLDAVEQLSNRTASDHRDQLATLAATLRAQHTSPPPIRLIHHFACTGGTMISRFVAATPNARVLSEIDPLSPLTWVQFSPTSLALQYKNSGLLARETDLIAIFNAELAEIYTQTRLRGERLILRDHSHSHFCIGDHIPNRPSLRDIVAQDYKTLSVVTVRHPLDSFLSVLKNKFAQFRPVTLEEYARRYLTFLEYYADCPIFTYEEFVTTQGTSLQEICAALDLPGAETIGPHVPALAMTGDSGRGGTTLTLRPRRQLPPDVAAMRTNSPAYNTLCARLNYDP